MQEIKEVWIENAQFWQRISKEEKEQNFKMALTNVKMKKNPDIIDQRLVQILETIVE